MMLCWQSKFGDCWTMRTLFHRFFKAKFFPHGSILDVKVGTGSYAWKSILKGRDVVSKGMQWRVGNGSKIRIYQDN